LAGAALAINDPFDGAHEIRLMLDLVNGDRGRAAHKRFGIAARGVDGVQVIQGDIAPIAGGAQR
jgi:hypothetical protein